jgi:hypothetical protein
VSIKVVWIRRSSRVMQCLQPPKFDKHERKEGEGRENSLMTLSCASLSIANAWARALSLVGVFCMSISMISVPFEEAMLLGNDPARSLMTPPWALDPSRVDMRFTLSFFSLSARDVRSCAASGCITIVSMLPPERGTNGKFVGGDLTNTPLVAASSRIEIRLLSETRSVLEYLQKNRHYI